MHKQKCWPLLVVRLKTHPTRGGVNGLQGKESVELKHHHTERHKRVYEQPLLRDLVQVRHHTQDEVEDPVEQHSDYEQ